MDSRIPKGAISFMNESILDGFADLSHVSNATTLRDCGLQFHNAVVCADVQDLPTKLMSQVRDSGHMFVLVS